MDIALVGEQRSGHFGTQCNIFSQFSIWQENGETVGGFIIGIVRIKEEEEETMKTNK